MIVRFYNFFGNFIGEQSLINAQIPEDATAFKIYDVNNKTNPLLNVYIGRLINIDDLYDPEIIKELIILIGDRNFYQLKAWATNMFNHIDEYNLIININDNNQVFYTTARRGDFAAQPLAFASVFDFIKQNNNLPATNFSQEIIRKLERK